MSITPLTFTGVSTYSNDLQTILGRAVQIANLPIQQVQNEDADVLQKKTLLASMSSAVGSVATTLQGMGKLANNKGLAASSSDATKVTATSTGAGNVATYQITQISKIATAASENSLAGYPSDDSTQVSADGKVEIMYGTYDQVVTLTKNNLAGLRDTINNLGIGLNASVITTSTGTNPNYLSVSAATTGQTTLRVIGNPTGTPADLLTQTNQGSDLAFKFNGFDVTRKSNTVNDLVGGLSLSFTGTTKGTNGVDTGQSISVTLNPDGSQLSSALSDLATNYNALATQVNAQFGPNAGLLSGDPTVRQIQQYMRNLTGFAGTGSGSIHSLAALGISLDQTGKMSFDSSTFNKLTSSQLADAFTFLGSSSTGIGVVASSFTSVSDPITGLIKTQQNSLTAQDKRLTSKIADLTDKANAMQIALASRLQTADTLLASLQSQQNMLTGSVEALNYTLYGKAPNS